MKEKTKLFKENKMPKFIITLRVNQASGYQEYEIEAETEAEAKKLFEDGEGEFLHEEIEVIDTTFDSIRMEKNI